MYSLLLIGMHISLSRNLGTIFLIFFKPKRTLLQKSHSGIMAEKIAGVYYLGMGCVEKGENSMLSFVKKKSAAVN